MLIAVGIRRTQGVMRLVSSTPKLRSDGLPGDNQARNPLAPPPYEYRGGKIHVERSSVA
jgi:hypothetical protein